MKAIVLEHLLGSLNGDFASEAQTAYPALVRAATVLCRSKSDVEDVVQETLLSALKSYASFRRDSSFLTWSYTILARTARAVNQVRSKSIPVDYVMGHSQELPPVDHALISDEASRHLIGAIRALPEQQREVMTLRFLQELSYAEIAEALGLSVGTVKATVFQARTSLRTVLAKESALRKANHVLS